MGHKVKEEIVELLQQELKVGGSNINKGLIYLVLLLKL